MNRLLLILGTVFINAGLLSPWLKRIHLFHLAGDISHRAPGIQIRLPDHDDADRERRPLEKLVLTGFG
jgi:Protein of unknown function (DUF2905)